MSPIEVPIYDPLAHSIMPERERYFTSIETDGNGNYVIRRTKANAPPYGSPGWNDNPESFWGRMEIKQTLNIGNGRQIYFVLPVEFYIPATTMEEAWNLFESTADPILKVQFPELKPNNV